MSELDIPRPILETVPAWTTPEDVAQLVEVHGTPLYVYSQEQLEQQAAEALDLGGPFGLVVRFAMKANPHPEVLEIFRQQGLHIDASSGREAETAIAAGYRPDQIMLTAQEIPVARASTDSKGEAMGLKELVDQGVIFNATSLHQLETYGKLFPGGNLCVRINPGMGSGMNNRTNTGGVSSSFGIWHEYIPEVKGIAAKYDLTIDKVHTHIGSGTDPVAWQQAAETSLKIVEAFPEAVALNLGGGFKVGRMTGEPSADMTIIGQHLEHLLKEFAIRTGRELKLEIEPGTFLVANAGALIAEVIDKTDTGSEGYTFLRTNTGMNDLLRPSMYGAQQLLTVVERSGELPQETQEVIVVGHNCESGDILTPAPGDPETLKPRWLGKAAIGDIMVIGGAGAYGRTMAPSAYNGYAPAPEIII